MQSKNVTLILELDLGASDSGEGVIVPDIEYWEKTLRSYDLPLKVVGIRVEEC